MNLTKISAFLCATMLVAASAMARETGPELAMQARRAMDEGEFEQAIQLYDQALAISDDPRIAYNKAIAHYRRGELEQARQLFANVVGEGENAIAAKARFNLGNTDYAEAVQLLGQQQSEGAIAKLRSAIEHYRRAIAIDRKDRDARSNIELAYRLLKKLEQETEPQEQDQQQDPSDQEQDQDQQDDSQQQDQNQNQQNGPQEDQQESDDSQEEQQSSENNDDQQSSSDRSNESQQSDDPQTQDESQSSDQNQDSDSDQQQQNEQSDPGQDEATSAKDEQQANQPLPEGDLKPANESAQPPQESPAEFKEGQKMTLEEARKMLQAVRDRNLRRRLQKRRVQVRPIPVEKDW